jgi:nitroreductase
VEYSHLLELVKKRRSIRKFKADPIPNDYLGRIMEVARWAPSGNNSQPWEFIIIKKRELKADIIEIIKDHGKFMRKMELTREPELRYVSSPLGWVHAPVFILVCGDTRTKQSYPNHMTIMRGSDIFISSLANAYLYMTLAVTTLGLGGQWVSAVGAPYVQCLIKNLLAIPEELAIYDMLAVGYPDVLPKPRPMRNRAEMVHYDIYEQSRHRSDQQIKKYISNINRAKRRTAGSGGKQENHVCIN